MFNVIAKFNHKAELRESKDEMLVGELVRSMARQNYTAIQFVAGDDRQQMKFRALQDPVLSNVYLVLDRKTGTGIISAALVGSKATLTLSAEVKNYLSDPDDLVHMFRTDLANMFKLPMMGGIRLNHELNSIFATTTFIIDIDNYVLKGEAGVQSLVAFLGQKIVELREKLAPFKKPTR